MQTKEFNGMLITDGMTIAEIALKNRKTGCLVNVIAFNVNRIFVKIGESVRELEPEELEYIKEQRINKVPERRIKFFRD